MSSSHGTPGPPACSFQCHICVMLNGAVQRMAQMAATGDPAALGPATSTVPWATCSAVRTLFAAVFLVHSPSRTPEASAASTLREALVRGLAKGDALALR